MDEVMHQHKLIKDYMDKHGLIYDEIDYGQNGKRGAMCYIDDKGVAFDGMWVPVLRRVKELKERAEGNGR